MSCCVKGIAACLDLLDPPSRPPSQPDSSVRYAAAESWVSLHLISRKLKTMHKSPHRMPANLCREAALHFLQSALAQPDHTQVQKASSPVSVFPPIPPLGQQTSRPLNSLLTHLSQLPLSTSATHPQDTQTNPAPTPKPPLHQQLLQQAQLQHQALKRLIKISADIALGSSWLLPASGQALAEPADKDPPEADGVEQWVLLGRLLAISDGYAHMLHVYKEDFLPDHKRRRTPAVAHKVLLHLTAVADATGQAQR